MNVFGTIGGSQGNAAQNINFLNFQNGLEMYETNKISREWENLNYRVGTDFYLGDKNIVGFVVNGNNVDSEIGINNSIELAQEASLTIDSILVANSISNVTRKNAAYNLNYRYDDAKKGRSLGIDLDYGSYVIDEFRTLPNQYFEPDLQTVLTEVNNWFDTPTDITITTGKIDYEDKLFGGKIGIGAKYSNVFSDNTFLVYEEVDGEQAQDDTLSNLFEYDESVYAGYVEYTRQITDKIGFSGGVRAEYTDLIGKLIAFVPDLEEPPVEQSYLQWFPSAGLTWQIKPTHAVSLNYSRRINRPNYEVLNPFNSQLSQLSFEKGNPRLRAEIVNNAEIGYTLDYRFNFKLAYSKTDNQITRLIGPDDVDPRASFISWDNLATQTVWSFNASLPMQVTKKWSSYVNLSASHINNQADYGENGTVDIQAFTYNIYTQNTFELPKKFKGEISGWFSGPGVWGGVFLYDESWSLNLGLQRTFLGDALNVKVSANDIFKQMGWSGTSEFNGLYGEGEGNWDSRWVSLSIGYTFGNQNVKSRRHETGMQDEAGRVGGE
jgi:outer membrane receptor protein involved in Fe transport